MAGALDFSQPASANTAAAATAVNTAPRIGRIGKVFFFIGDLEPHRAACMVEPTSMIPPLRRRQPTPD
ncbi:hypothetical protein C6T58_29100 [Burkholderia multivorans]|nr:hypothetical protein C6Q11_26250 [Burkholderia multivorans]PRG73058.1 hypothetical protein C6T58_29100 [Burkholderia multivorans]